MLCNNCSDADLVGAFSKFDHLKDWVTSRPITPERWFPSTPIVVVRKSDREVCWNWTPISRKPKRLGFCNLCDFLQSFFTGQGILLKRELKKPKPIYQMVLRAAYHHTVSSLSVDIENDKGISLLPKNVTIMIDDSSFGHRNEALSLTNTKAVPSFISPQSFDRMKSLIRDCRHCRIGQHTKESCQPPQLSFAKPIKVIDCQSRTIIIAPLGCEYASLSYVWGPAEAGAPDTATLDFPATIVDAINVTLKLGYSYLWVDRYCIDQTNELEKHGQIIQMDRIYQNSQVCIIAAAGSHPHYGLPGVSIGRTAYQAQFMIEGLTFFTYLHDLELVYHSNKATWGKRSWTFQEFLSSRRRLFFTDVEMRVECGTGWYREVYQSRGAPVEQIVTRLTWPPASPVNSLPDIVAAYSGRKLTYPGDILNAFSGIEQAYKLLDPNFRFYWGIPFLLNVPATFRCGLFWTLIDIGRNVGTLTLQRRDGFPTWSWTGCLYSDNVAPLMRCIVNPYCTPKHWKGVLDEVTIPGNFILDSELFFENDSGATLSIAAAGVLDHEQEKPQTLVMKSYFLRVLLYDRQDLPVAMRVYDGESYLEFDTEQYSAVLFQNQQEVLRSQGFLECVALFLDKPDAPWYYTHETRPGIRPLMLLNQHGAVWHRVGVARLDFQCICRIGLAPIDYKRVQVLDMNAHGECSSDEEKTQISSLRYIPDPGLFKPVRQKLHRERRRVGSNLVLETIKDLECHSTMLGLLNGLDMDNWAVIEKHMGRATFQISSPSDLIALENKDNHYFATWVDHLPIHYGEFRIQ